MSSVSKGILPHADRQRGAAVGHAAQADLIAAQPAPHSQAGRVLAQSRLAELGVDPAVAAQRVDALAEAEVAALALEPRAPAGGEPGTVALVFLLMCVAIFVLSLRPN